MGNIYSIFIFIILAVVMPFIVGGIWEPVLTCKSVLARYLFGYITVLAAFEVVCVPFCVFKWKFSAFVITFSLICLAVCIAILKQKFRADRNQLSTILHTRQLSKPLEYVYLIAFVVSLIYVFYMTLRYSGIRWNGDDYTYLTYSNAVIRDNRMYMTDVTTGNFTPVVESRRYFQYFMFFISYLSALCGTSVTAMARGYLAINLMILAFIAIWLLSESLLDTIENRLIFMLLVSVVYIWGESSYFSVTYRLLGPIWQGKAVLAVVIQPLLFYIYPKFLREEYTRIRGIFLLVLSLCAVSLTMGGVLTMLANSLLFTVLFIIFNRFSKDKLLHSGKNLLYVLWSDCLPVVIGLIYWSIK